MSHNEREAIQAKLSALQQEGQLHQAICQQSQALRVQSAAVRQRSQAISQQSQAARWRRQQVQPCIQAEWKGAGGI